MQGAVDAAPDMSAHQGRWDHAAATRPGGAGSKPAGLRYAASLVRVVSDSHYLSTLDAVYVYAVPWSEFPIVPSYPHYLHPSQEEATYK